MVGRLYTREFVQALREHDCVLAPTTAIWWANRYGLGAKFGGRWQFDPRSVPLLAEGKHPSEVVRLLQRLDQDAA